MSAALSPRLQSLALSPFDVIYNCVTRQMKFAPPPEAEDDRPRPRGRTPGTKTAREMGAVKAVAVKAVAVKVVDGEITGESYNAIGEAHGVNGDSLKAAVCRERNRRAALPKKEHAA